VPSHLFWTVEKDPFDVHVDKKLPFKSHCCIRAGIFSPWWSRDFPPPPWCRLRRDCSRAKLAGSRCPEAWEGILSASVHHERVPKIIFFMLTFVVWQGQGGRGQEDEDVVEGVHCLKCDAFRWPFIVGRCSRCLVFLTDLGWKNRQCLNDPNKQYFKW